MLDPGEQCPPHSQPMSRQPRQAPPVGRALRLLLGFVLLVDVAPIYLEADGPLVLGASALVLGLVAVYTLIHFVVSRGIVALGPGLGAVAAVGLLVALYVGGAPGSLILGRGEGKLAAVTFLGISLVVAGVRADPGCELMAVPGALLRQRTELACLVFSPLDRLERRLRSKRAA